MTYIVNIFGTVNISEFYLDR